MTGLLNLLIGNLEIFSICFLMLRIYKNLVAHSDFLLMAPWNVTYRACILMLWIRRYPLVIPIFCLTKTFSVKKPKYFPA